MDKNKFFIVTTIPASLNFFKGQCALLNQYFEVSVVSSQREKLELFGFSEGVRTHCISMKRPISLFYDLISLCQFVFLFLRERPKVVHGNTPKASLLSMLAAKVTGVPVRIYMCHGLRYQGSCGFMRKLLMSMERLSCLCATEVLCVSEGVRETLIEDKICSSSKCRVILHGSANGIDLNLFDPDKVDISGLRAQIGIPDTDFVFLFVGRIVKDKGINELVGAFNRLSKEYMNISLLLVGAEEKNLNPISMEASLVIKENPKIFAVGSKENVKPYMLLSDAFVLPSYREGFGMVLIEAGALSKPCITTDIIGCNEIILPGENGVIIPSKDEEALYQAMENFLLHPEEVQRMAEKARPLIASRYDQKMVWRALLKEYKRIIGE